ncbi:hypothetical protein AJ80_03833 [Polytolypa hystricis UAMH7299]|uniref:Alpha/beta hydrolase fold-3 domain-containing protein n=1 Tax=Polytolypa hystricis (strain UAMH7299) TaxID=1447883 RepID=A0A2B7YFJ3_POLH7|nr:hypothetical protein AJ80_03833 [Polytolypa hystricis UAMH7299]
MAATLSSDGYDLEFEPLRDAAKESFKQLWSLPHDQFMEAWASSPAALTEDTPKIEEIDVSHELIPVRDGEKIELQVYRPKGVQGVLPLYLVFHGGGWVVGSHSVEEATNRFVCVKNKVVVVSVDYRMAPKYKFPYAVNDAFDALKWCRDNASKLSIDTQRTILAGGSAGSNIATALALKLRDENLLSGVIGQMLNIPATCHPDLADQAAKRYNRKMTSFEENKDGYVVTKDQMYWFWNHYTTKAESHPYASPLLAESHANLPPALVQVSERDTLRDEGLAYAAALKAAGVPVKLNTYPGLPHAFYMFTELKQTARYHAAVVEWVGELLENSGKAN